MEKYLFPTGAIREVEKNLFDPNDLERMIDAPDAREGFKIFNELSYADELLDADNPEKYAEILAHDLGQVRDFMYSITPDEKIMMLMLASYDFHNLKVIFKAKLAGKEEAGNLSELGHVEAEKFVDYILKAGEVVVVPEEYEALIRDMVADFVKMETPSAIDGYLDKKYFSFSLDIAKSIGDNYLTMLVRSKIDMANIKIVVRSKFLGRTRDEVDKDIIGGGNWNGRDLLDVYDEELGATIKKLSNVLTDSETIADLTKFLENSEPWRLEKTLDNHIVRIIKNSKIRSHGPRTMAAYFLGKKNAMKNIRIIMGGLVNNIDSNEIKERVRELY